MLRNRYHLFLQMLIFILLNGSPNKNIGHNLWAPIFMSGVNLFLLANAKEIQHLKKIVSFCMFVIFVFILQLLFLPKCKISTTMLSKIMYGATILIIFKDNFREWYLKMMTYLSFFSLIMWGLWISTGFYVDIMKQSGVYDMIIYSIRYGMGVNDSLRNSGPFWEPGAFACYLLLVPIMYFNDMDSAIAKYKKYYILLLLTLMSTMSTTGYVCLILLVFLFYINKNPSLKSFFWLVPILCLFYYSWLNIEFLNDKFMQQYDNSISANGDFTADRLGSFLYDLNIIIDNPLIGVSFEDTNRYDIITLEELLMGEIHANGNGLSSILVAMGVPFIIFWCYLLYSNNKGYMNVLQFVSVIFLVFALLMGEPLFNYTMMYLFPYIKFKPISLRK